MALINKIEDKKQIVRRYMDYPKFLTLLTTESIYFAKPNEFKDPLDALCPKFIGLSSSPEIKQMDKENYEKLAEEIFQNMHQSLNLLLFGKKPTKQQLIDSFDNYVMSLMLNNIQVTSEIYIKYKNKVGRIINSYIDGDSKQALELLSNLLLENSREREISLQEITGKRALISCWQICEEESDLMWQCYTKSDGIMIETTVEKLENLNYAPFIDKDASCIIDKVKYINLSEYHEKCNSLTIKDNIEELNKDFLYNYFVKSKSLSDEKELRILIAGKYFSIKRYL